MGLATPLDRVVGPQTAKALAKLDLHTVADLLRHYPRRYIDPGRMTDFGDLPEGDHVTVIARTKSATMQRLRNGNNLLRVVVTDGYRDLELAFFGKNRGFLASREHMLRPGRTALVTGTVKRFRGKPSLNHPDYEFLDDHEDSTQAIEEAGRPIPVYPAGAAIPTWRIRTAVQTVLDPLTEAELPDPLPAHVRERHQLPTLLEALRLVHGPHTDIDWRRGQHRLRFEEAFVLQTALAQRRAAAGTDAAVARPLRADGIRGAFLARLPFALTDGQREVDATISAELATTRPMQRLLQGEVGSGKTVVAMLAMLQVIDAGAQTAMLAPTEVLAAQHARSMSHLLGPLAEAGMLGGAGEATRVVLLTGAMPAAARRAALADIASGRAGIVVGTHALLSEHVQFAELGLVVVDEQHRFGVEQRDALRGKSLAIPHQLVMTATPIPRTVAMTVFGDLETSTLREVPAGRAGVSTHVCPADNPSWSRRTWELVREQVDAGGRVFVVCPRITATQDEQDDAPEPSGLHLVTDEEGDASGTSDASTLLPEAAGKARAPEPHPLAAVDEIAARLRITPQLAGIEIGELHGRLSSEEKDAVMADFTSGRVPVLVTTTVIEVGVDVPEATAMVIMDAERFGLSQLHQLRGRIGRGEQPATCLAWTRAADPSPTLERLRAFAGTTDGFELAELDLAHRREGDVLGAAQHGGASSLRLLRVLSDGKIIDDARRDARALVAEGPGLSSYPHLAEAIADQLDPQRADYLHRS